MLRDIRIRGLGVISDAVLEFGPGLTVVTGETGAGKTMVISGLTLLLGGRADLSRLRPGVQAASVEGRLDVALDGEVARRVLEAGGDLEQDCDLEPADSSNVAEEDLKAPQPGTLIIRRVISAAGRSRAVMGGASVPASLLAKLGSQLVVVHGQSDQLRLTQLSEQRGTLDRYAGLDLTPCRQAFSDWQDAQRELDRRVSGARELAREADVLRAGLSEIEVVAPEPAEDSELAALSARLEHADALRAAVNACRDALSENSEAAEPGPSDVQSLLARCHRALELVVGTDPQLDDYSVRLNGVAADVADIAADLSAYEAHLGADPERLSAVFTRRAVLATLTRKYGPDVSAVLAWAKEARNRLDETDTSEHVLAQLARRRDTSRSAYLLQAKKISESRRSAALELSRRITEELGGLGMPTAAVRFDVHPRPATQSMPMLEAETLEAPALEAETLDARGATLNAETAETADAGTMSAEAISADTISAETVGAGAEGIDEVTLGFQAHQDAPILAIQRSASGGELSRVMLAIEVVLAGSDPVATMVFDEVDAGVGGRAAVEVGRRLAALALSHQVIVVTHLAQVAAFADHHLVVDKGLSPAVGESEDGVTRSDIRAVSGADRVAELARMLAGDSTAVARQHAAELLVNARSASAGAGQ